MVNKLPPRELRASSDRFPRSHESLSVSRSEVISSPPHNAGTGNSSGGNLLAASPRPGYGGSVGNMSISEEGDGGSGVNGGAGVKGAGARSIAMARSHESLQVGGRANISMVKSHDSLQVGAGRKRRSKEGLNAGEGVASDDKEVPQGTRALGLVLSTGQALSPAVSMALAHGSRDMLGSSFQLSHVVPEDPEEEERVPTRVPTTTVAAAFAVLDREHWEREEEGSDDGGVREEGGDEQFQAVVSPGFTEEETGVIREEEEEADETMVVVVREETVHPPSHLEPIQQPPLPPLPVQQREAPVDLLGAAAVGQEPNAGGAQKDSLREHDAVMAGLGRVPEADQVEVIFRDLRYKVQVKVTKKDPDTGKTRRGIVENREILNGISGRFRPGKFTAIMGASGAGKTSLLNVIAGEVHFGEVSGQILVNNKELFGNDIKSLSGFVFQDDVLLPSMTVREAITMSALLRLPPETPQAERNEKVDEMINTLNLTKASNTIIGDSTIKGVSGGERKRCAMGMEMLTRPAVLFLDEPTSGLDTFTALAVIRTLKALAATGRTVIATLHQPSSEIFRLFDDFILMADGRIMYSGPASESISYFGRSGYPCPRNSNPTDFFFMSILNTDPSIERLQGEEPGSSVRRVSGLLDTWDASPENSALATSLACPTRTGGAATSTKKGQAGVLTQFSYLYTRASKNAYRNPLVLRSKVIQTVAVSVMIGLLYLRTDNLTGMSGVQNRIGVLFFLGMINVFTSSNANLTVFGKEKGVFLREHGAGYYNITPYFLGKFMAELPLYVVFPALQTLIVYYMVGLQQDAGKVLICLITSIMSSLVGMAIGIFFACAFQTLQMALVATPLILMPLMLFAGVFVQSASIPKWIGWLQYLSPIKYGFEALAKNEFTGLMFPMAVNTVTNAPLAYFQGETEISALGLADDNLTVGVCIIILTCMTVALIMGAYGMLVNLTVSRSRLKRAGQAGSSGKGGDARKGDMRKVAPMNEKM